MLRNVFNRVSMIPHIALAPEPMAVQAERTRNTLEAAFGEKLPEMSNGLESSI